MGKILENFYFVLPLRRASCLSLATCSCLRKVKIISGFSSKAVTNSLKTPKEKFQWNS